MKGSQTPLCRRILAYLKDAICALDLVAGAPPGDEGAGQRGVIEVDCDRVVQDAVQTSWRHRPAVGAAIRVQPCPYLVYTLPEAAAARTPAPSSPS
jgi:hypothetical protein